MHACMHALVDGLVDGWKDGWMDRIAAMCPQFHVRCATCRFVRQQRSPHVGEYTVYI